MWLFVPSLSALGSAASTSGSGLLAPIVMLWGLSSGKPSLLPSSSPQWNGATWLRLLSGIRSQPSTADRGVAAWISSLPATPVSPSRSPGSAAVSTTSDGSGETSGGSFATWAPGTSSWKMSPVTSRGRSRGSSATWPRAGGLRNGTAFRQPPSAPRTFAIASSFSGELLPTPNAVPYGSSQNGINGIGGENERPSANKPSLWTMAARGMLPTPTARDHKGATAPGKSGDLVGEVRRRLQSPTSSGSPVPTERRGQGDQRLNPAFVEWMMGLPAGWTTIGTGQSDSTRSATRSSRRPPPQPSMSSGGGSTPTQGELDCPGPGWSQVGLPLGGVR